MLVAMISRLLLLSVELPSSRDVNFVFFQKSIIVFKKSIFFSIIEFGRRSPTNAIISRRRLNVLS